MIIQVQHNERFALIDVPNTFNFAEHYLLWQQWRDKFPEFIDWICFHQYGELVVISEKYII